MYGQKLLLNNQPSDKARSGYITPAPKTEPRFERIWQKTFKFCLTNSNLLIFLMMTFLESKIFLENQENLPEPLKIFPTFSTQLKAFTAAKQASLFHISTVNSVNSPLVVAPSVLF